MSASYKRPHGKGQRRRKAVLDTLRQCLGDTDCLEFLIDVLSTSGAALNVEKQCGVLAGIWLDRRKGLSEGRTGA